MPLSFSFILIISLSPLYGYGRPDFSLADGAMPQDFYFAAGAVHDGGLNTYRAGTAIQYQGQPASHISIYIIGRQGAGMAGYIGTGHSQRLPHSLQ